VSRLVPLAWSSSAWKCPLSPWSPTDFATQLRSYYRHSGLFFYHGVMLSVLWHCWLGVRISIWPVKVEWWGVGVVISLEWGADCLYMVQLMPLHPKTPSSLASFRSRLVLPYWYQLTQVVLEKRPLNGCSSSSSSSIMVQLLLKFGSYFNRILYRLYLPTVILTVIWYSITHSLFHSRLKTSFSANPSHRRPFFFFFRIHYRIPQTVYCYFSAYLFSTFSFFLFSHFLVVGSVQ